MAIAQPAFVSFEYGQDGTWTVALDPEEDVTGWTVSTTIRAYNGGTALVEETIAGGGVTVSNYGTGVFVTTFSAADLTLNTFGPGAYVIQMHRTNSGYTYPITDPSCLLIRPADSTAYPTMTNLGEYAAHALLGLTLSDNLAKQYLQLLFAAEDWVKRYCQKDWAYRASVTEYYDGTGTQDLLLLRTPVYPSTVAIREDAGGYYGQASDAFATTTALTLGTDYTVPIDPRWADGLSHSGLVRRLNGVWPYQRFRPTDHLGYQKQPRPGSIRATYTGGYALMPHSLKLAVWTMATLFAESATTGRLMQSESGEGYSYGAGSDPLANGPPPLVKTLLAPFRSGTCFVR